jgi:hypothetical protein
VHVEAKSRHEVRNALTNLSAVSTLMTPNPEAVISAGGSLTVVIDDELARLRGRLEDSAPSGDTNVATVDSVLTRMPRLRRAAGARITLDCPVGLVAALPGATLAQVSRTFSPTAHGTPRAPRFTSPRTGSGRASSLRSPTPGPAWRGGDLHLDPPRAGTHPQHPCQARGQLPRRGHRDRPRARRAGGTDPSGPVAVDARVQRSTLSGIATTSSRGMGNTSEAPHSPM